MPHPLRRVAAGIVLLLAVAALAGCSPEPRAAAQSVPNAPQPLETVSAAGHGEVKVAPDRAAVEFTVSVQDRDGKRALNGASAKAARLTKALRRAGVAKVDLQTTGVNLWPDRTNTGRIIRYTASISVRAVLTDIGRVGSVIAAGAGAGATDFSGPSFFLSKENAANDEAIEAAVADAKRRAEIMAKAAGKSVGDVIAIGEPALGQGPVPYYKSEAAYDRGMALAGAPQIEPGRLDAQAQVSVTFELR